MKEIKEEAKRHHEAKLHKYGASHEERACGGSMKKYAHGGHVHEVDLECKGKTGPEIKRAHGGKVHHSDEKEDEALMHKELKPGAFKHRRADGGPIVGGPGPKLGRGRKGGKGKTSVNIAIGKPGGDSAGAPPMMPPPALGAGPSAMPPKPMPPVGPPAGLPPRPGMAGPMKRGGKVGHHKHEKHHGHSEHHHKKVHKHQAR